MSALAEQVREALHIGDFQPTSLEAEERSLTDAGVFADHLRRLEHAARAFERDTMAFLTTTGAFLTESPYPRVWRQTGPNAPAEPSHAPVPTEHAALFAAELHARLAESVPRTAAAALDADVVKPLAAWLAGYDSAKERLSVLQHRRLEYDAARRRLEAAARTAGAHPTDAQAERQLGRTEAESEPVLVQFDAERTALAQHLAWLASAAARLKAYIADTAIAMRQAAVGHAIPAGLLEPYPGATAPETAPEGAPRGPASPRRPAIFAPTAPLSSLPPAVMPPPEGPVAKPGGAGFGGFLADTLKSAVGLATGPPGGLAPHKGRARREAGVPPGVVLLPTSEAEGRPAADTGSGGSGQDAGSAGGVPAGPQLDLGSGASQPKEEASPPSAGAPPHTEPAPPASAPIPAEQTAAAGVEQEQEGGEPGAAKGRGLLGAIKAATVQGGVAEAPGSLSQGLEGGEEARSGLLPEHPQLGATEPAGLHPQRTASGPGGDAAAGLGPGFYRD